MFREWPPDRSKVTRQQEITKMAKQNYPAKVLIAAIRLDLAAQVLLEKLRCRADAMAGLRKAQAEFAAAWKQSGRA
jgi:hypothetical protein